MREWPKLAGNVRFKKDVIFAVVAQANMRSIDNDHRDEQSRQWFSNYEKMSQNVPLEKDVNFELGEGRIGKVMGKFRSAARLTVDTTENLSAPLSGVQLVLGWILYRI